MRTFGEIGSDLDTALGRVNALRTEMGEAAAESAAAIGAVLAQFNEALLKAQSELRATARIEIPAALIEVACIEARTTANHLMGKNRRSEAVLGRYLVYHGLHQMGWDDGAIARCFNKDRTGVYAGRTRVGEWASTDLHMKDMLRRVDGVVGNGTNGTDGTKGTAATAVSAVK